MTNREIGDALGYHWNDITGMLEKAMAKLKRLARALRGSVPEQKEALENPNKVMTGEGETISLFNPGDIPMQDRELKRRKRQHKTNVTENNTGQLRLF